MNHNKLKAALKKYGDLFKSDKNAAIEAINLDFSAEEAAELIAALNAPEAEPAKEHEYYKWYDDFDARIQKREVVNQYTNTRQTIITGWSLEKKKYPKFIEPHIAVQLNSFADGYDTLGVGSMLVPKDSANPGTLITYENWALEQGRDLSKDINILLSKN
jgi:hypothetical protein